MAYRKLKANKIFSGTELTEDRVLIVSESGSVIDLVPQAEAGGDLETLEGILCPGFINAHCHTELSHMKGALPAEIGMVPFLTQVMFERQAPDAVKQQAVQDAIDEMYRNGIVAAGDTCNTDDSVGIKSGNRQMCFHNFIETSGFVPTGAGLRMEQALDLHKKFVSYFSGSNVSITPHAAYSVSPKLFQLISDQSPSLISIHNQESQAEEDFVRHKTGELLSLFHAIGVNIDFFEAQHKSSLQYLLPMLPQSGNVLLVHNCYTTREDIAALKKQKGDSAFFFCVCPNANLYIGNTLPQLSMLMESGFPICIGTDSLASNGQLSVLAELQTLHRHFPLIPLAVLLQWATLNGADALQISGEYGSFSKGKKPGVLLLQRAEENINTISVERII